MLYPPELRGQTSESNSLRRGRGPVTACRAPLSCPHSASSRQPLDFHRVALCGQGRCHPRQRLGLDGIAADVAAVIHVPGDQSGALGRDSAEASRAAAFACWTGAQRPVLRSPRNLADSDECARCRPSRIETGRAETRAIAGGVARGVLLLGSWQ